MLGDSLKSPGNYYPCDGGSRMMVWFWDNRHCDIPEDPTEARVPPPVTGIRCDIACPAGYYQVCSAPIFDSIPPSDSFC